MPVVLFRGKGDKNIVAVWKIVESEETLLKILPDDEQLTSNLKNYKNQSKRLEWLASRVLLYKFTGKNPLIEYNKYGQPFIRRLSRGISITHTTGYAAISITNSSINGIDIEIPSPRILRVAERFVHPDEFIYIPDNEKINYYTLLWCAKETMFKMLKRTGIIFNEELLIKPFKIENEGVLTCAELFKREREFNLHYLKTSGFFLVWSD